MKGNNIDTLHIQDTQPKYAGYVIVYFQAFLGRKIVEF